MTDVILLNTFSIAIRRLKKRRGECYRVILYIAKSVQLLHNFQLFTWNFYIGTDERRRRTTCPIS